MGKLVAGATAQRKVIRNAYCLQMAGLPQGFTCCSATRQVDVSSSEYAFVGFGTGSHRGTRSASRRRQSSIATRRQSDRSVFTTEQTRVFTASIILLRCSHDDLKRKKSGPSKQNRGVFSSVSVGSEKSVHGGKITAPCGAVVEHGLRGPALSEDSASSCSCLSPST